MMLFTASLTVALIILAIKYARKCVEVSELRRALIEADARAMPRIDYAAFMARLAADREEELNQHGGPL